MDLGRRVGTEREVEFRGNHERVMVCDGHDRPAGTDLAAIVAVSEDEGVERVESAVETADDLAASLVACCEGEGRKAQNRQHQQASSQEKNI